MLDIIAKRKYEDLFQEISNTYRQWPERQQKVFSLAHYRGQSPETIARSLKLKMKEVDAILKQCEHGLHDSLRNFRDSSPEQTSSTVHKAVGLAASAQDTKTAHALASKIRSIRSRSRIPA